MSHNLKNKIEIERRKYFRIKSKNLITCKKFTVDDFSNNYESDDMIHAVLKNYTAGGLLFESVIKFNIGELLKLDITIPGWEKFKSEFYKEITSEEEQSLIILAKVVRVEAMNGDSKFEIGVSFSAIDKGHREALMKYIDQKIKEEKSLPKN